MWPTRTGARNVSCIACGTTVTREEAREYDKHGDRWDRDGKEFEYLCKPCYRELSNASREGLESSLVEAGAGEVPREEFLHRYLAAIDDAR